MHPSGWKLRSEVSAFCPVSGTAVPIGQYSGVCFDRSLLCNSLSHPPAPQAFVATVLLSECGIPLNEHYILVYGYSLICTTLYAYKCTHFGPKRYFTLTE